MDGDTDHTYAPRPSSVDLREDMSTAQLAELLKALDETRVLLNNLYQTRGGSESARPIQPSAKRRKSWWGRHCWPSGRRFIYRYITVFTVIIQALNLLMLTIMDVIPRHLVEEYKMLIASSAIMIALQVANLFILILATGRLARQVMSHAVNSIFLAQSYLATLLLFAGLYTVIYRLDKHSWKFLNEDLTSNPVQVFNLYFKFLFYSISTATLCGSDNALPVTWYNHLFAGTQMLLSFCYFASILGMALSPGQPKPKEKKGPDSSNEQFQPPCSNPEDALSHIRFDLPITDSRHLDLTMAGDGNSPASYSSQTARRQTESHRVQKWFQRVDVETGPRRCEGLQTQVQDCLVDIGDTGLESPAVSPHPPRPSLESSGVLAHHKQGRLHRQKRLHHDNSPYLVPQQHQQQIIQHHQQQPQQQSFLEQQQQQQQQQQNGTISTNFQPRPHSYLDVAPSGNIQYGAPGSDADFTEHDDKDDDEPLLIDGNQTIANKALLTRQPAGIRI